MTVKEAIDELFNLVDIIFPEVYEELSSTSDNSKRLKDAVESLLQRRHLPLDIMLRDSRLQPAPCKVQVIHHSERNV
jgi:hypothetical protein